MTRPTPPGEPGEANLHELTDDDLSWDEEVHGRMIDFASEDDAVTTVPWED